MIDLLLFMFSMGILVLLYFQWKVKRQQERLIETEAEALRELQQRNSQFKESGLFGLPAGNSYLGSGGRTSGLMVHRRKVMGRKKRMVSR